MVRRALWQCQDVDAGAMATAKLKGLRLNTPCKGPLALWSCSWPDLEDMLQREDKGDLRELAKGDNEIGRRGEGEMDEAVGYIMGSCWSTLQRLRVFCSPADLVA